MGRDTSGMEDDRPETCENKMPGYIGFEEGNGKLYCSLPTETSVTDSKVERSVGDLSHVLNANSAVILNRVGRESEIQPQRVKQNNGNDDEDKHAGSNGHGDADSRATALEILNRSVGILSRSRSLSRKQYNTDSQRGENVTNWVVSDQRVNVGDCAQSNRESGEVKIQEELFYYPGSETSVLEDAESDSDEYYYNCESRSKSIPLDQSYFDKEHVYCTVYCIANNGIRDLEITERYSEAPTALQSGAGEGQTVHDDVGSSPELYSLSDLVDPLTSTRLSRQQSRVSTVATSCRVCLLDTSIVPLHCCGKSVCDECLKLYISSQVQVGKVYIVCPIPECSGFLEEGLVVSHLENEEVAKYHYFLELCQLDASTKPCPQCSLFTSLKTTTPNCTEHKYKIQCNKCQFVWCFKCHAPWHSGLKCRDYRRGDKLLRKWASVIEHGQRNAQKCPRCKIHIQRTEGCDHMTCTQCSTNFCYRCGERYRQLRFFGDHTSNLSVFGCKYRYHPDKPHLRRLIRGSVCVSKVVLAPVVFVLVMALGALSLDWSFFQSTMCVKERKNSSRLRAQEDGSERWEKNQQQHTQTRSAAREQGIFESFKGCHPATASFLSFTHPFFLPSLIPLLFPLLAPLPRSLLSLSVFPLFLLFFLFILSVVSPSIPNPSCPSWSEEPVDLHPAANLCFLVWRGGAPDYQEVGADCMSTCV